ncbi:E3 ubiquitin-protein ligase makorin-1 [Biomphalaria glabrata]|uniref:RING-type E3 ubiquitin transferase n=1 Tax=Biomphalaria glabrata TaxID=6526 RepID=A0A9W3A6L0_BIOGL|nr:probable E3 ubiquitin-protein ligase makorin-1 [Biomphalaria glabrata]XP_055882811.1 probable E3 ubiquitin-protein ligase makorin-1 [Biomphalaria glabrata]XP_055882813.1 probable E3 ubiquitin-protein ligase makorin-1 [Biomphalaria glabrata]XP_055882814.1 probable E3 ubiquitin-protein ligase makorin-1 [Biomphalaria glabrata]KAI8739593.1 putative E3 ubiquitin-protein ligase makorin-1 [Biomphalaria glabrata]KAI8771855.1 E3 ubiquitin-protein ligase makorin-1 [Biomphalaria glabrata]
MAEGGYEPNYRKNYDSRPKYNQVCRYFLHGSCNKGRECQFSHDKSRAVPMDTVCRYYLYGRCSYGDKCRYDHVKKDVQRDSQASSSPSVQNTENRRTPQKQQNALASNMVTLKKGGFDKSRAHSSNSSRNDHRKKWAMARDFVPGQKYYGAVSYADAVHPAMAHDSSSFEPREYEEGLCPYYALGECPYEENCAYLHGEICDLCGMPRLHPTDIEQREQHVRDCIAEHERQMELAFSVKQSKDKECGICLENVMEKEGKDSKRFGILENCNHCFCLSCIRQWRSNKNSLIETHRACPSCRTHSDFVTPSKYWVECPEEKKKLISDYKDALSKKPCHYFKLGKGECPFDSRCFYRHALPDGKVVTNNIVKRRRRENAEGDRIVDDENLLWDYISRRERDGESDYSLEDDLYMFLLETFQDDDDDDNNSSFIRFALRENLILSDTDSDSDDSYDY